VETTRKSNSKLINDDPILRNVPEKLNFLPKKKNKINMYRPIFYLILRVFPNFPRRLLEILKRLASPF